ncbi:DUF6894 family protein [Devosia sp. RR2S18]|uniref:DUF6894 family protein n=1 Tax=Devosia rhizosphaerae TaxID=3049774 RepID=UPI0025415873|nr:hypothetical protein [Devosia sp. RR2S18]WIJ25887.1 hypothetical protein QOV41_03740 [Devosia sp. RR2S18]
MFVIEGGQKLVDDSEHEAARSLGEMCRDRLTLGRDMQDLSIAVRDETGHQVLVASLQYSLFGDP